MFVPRWFSLVVILILAGISSPAGQAAEQKSRGEAAWSADFETAKSEAERLKRPLLIHFHADWCVPCRRMNRDVLKSPELAAQLKQNFVGVKVDADEHPELLKRFGVRSLPADVVVSPDGKVLIQTRGYQAKGKYVGRLARLGNRLRPEPVESESPEIEKETLPAKKQDRREDEKPPREPLPGLDGYSPVSLYAWREWRKGKPEFTAYHKGVAYRMVSEDELEKFTAKPDKYVPRLLGCDPVILQKTDRAVPGNTKYGAYFNGELYLFESPETRAEFKKSPKRYVKTRHVLKPEDIEPGAIRQSEKPAEPGDAVRQ